MYVERLCCHLHTLKYSKTRGKTLPRRARAWYTRLCFVMSSERARLEGLISVECEHGIATRLCFVMSCVQARNVLAFVFKRVRGYFRVCVVITYVRRIDHVQ